MDWSRIEPKPVREGVVSLWGAYHVFAKEARVYDLGKGVDLFLHEKNKTICMGVRVNGYVRYRSIALNKLLLLCFSDQELCRYVIHKDGDKDNYAIDNMFFSSRGQDVLDRLATYPERDFLNGERIYRWRDTSVYVSATGKAYNKVASSYFELIKRRNRMTGKVSVSVSYKCDRTQQSVHEMVQECVQEEVSYVDEDLFTAWQRRKSISNSLLQEVRSGKGRLEVCKKHNISNYIYYKIKNGRY